MKIRLLKLLRKKFFITYCYNYKNYHFHSPDRYAYFENLDECKKQLRESMINYARNHYPQYLRVKKIN